MDLWQSPLNQELRAKFLQTFDLRISKSLRSESHSQNGKVTELKSRGILRKKDQPRQATYGLFRGTRKKGLTWGPIDWGGAD
jgi:hypothetical protein